MSSETPTMPFITHLFISAILLHSSRFSVGCSTSISAKINTPPAASVAEVAAHGVKSFSGAIMNKLIALFILILSPILLAEVQMTPQQQEAANKLTAKGGLVIPLAADADSLVVSLNMAGKQATDADLAELKNLPKISQLNLANTAVTDAGLAN